MNQRKPDKNAASINGSPVRRVPVVSATIRIIGETAQATVQPQELGLIEFASPHMGHQAHVVITRPECVPQGLRLGDWSQVKE